MLHYATCHLPRGRSAYLSPGLRSGGNTGWASVRLKWRGPRSKGMRSSSCHSRSRTTSAFDCPASLRDTAQQNSHTSACLTAYTKVARNVEASVVVLHKGGTSRHAHRGITAHSHTLKLCGTAEQSNMHPHVWLPEVTQQGCKQACA